MIHKRLFISLVLVLMSISLFGQEGEQFKSVDVAEFAMVIANPDVVVLDVRKADEHESGNIPGTTLNIDVLQDTFTEIALSKIPEGKTVALYCRSGNRSKKAAKILASKGYTVIELATGFKGWQQQSSESKQEK